MIDKLQAKIQNSLKYSNSNDLNFEQHSAQLTNIYSNVLHMINAINLEGFKWINGYVSLAGFQLKITCALF